MFVKLGSLAGLSHVISLHFICWTVLYGNIALADLISDEEISVVDVPRSLAHTFLTILFQFDGTGVVLQNNRGLCLVPLVFQEIFCPQNLGHAIINGH